MHGQLLWSDSWKLCKKMSEMYLKYCRISFGFCIYPYCSFSWALSIFFPDRLHVACSFVISSWDSVCSSAISKNLVGSSEISERQSIYPPPTSCFLPWWSCMGFLLTSKQLSSKQKLFIFHYWILSSSDERVFTIYYHAINIFTSLRLDKFTPSPRIHQPHRLTLGWKILSNWRHGSAVIPKLSHARTRKIADVMTRIDGIIVFKNISELCKCPHI